MAWQGPLTCFSPPVPALGDQRVPYHLPGVRGIKVRKLPVVDRLLMFGHEHVLHPRGVLSPGAHVSLVYEHPGVGLLNDGVPDPARIRVQTFSTDDVMRYTKGPELHV